MGIKQYIRSMVLILLDYGSSTPEFLKSCHYSVSLIDLIKHKSNKLWERGLFAISCLGGKTMRDPLLQD